MPHSKTIATSINIALTVIVVGLALTDIGGSLLLTLLSLPFVLVMPGHAVTMLLFPNYKLEMSEGIVFSVGISLVIATLSGLILNLTPWGLRTESWVIWLGSISLIASSIALLRGSERPVVVHRSSTPVRLSLSLDQGLLFVLALLVVISAFLLAYLGEATQDKSTYTQFWLAPNDDADSRTVQLGIRNYEGQAVEYRVLVTLDQAVMLDEAPVVLAPGEIWSVTFPLPSFRNEIRAQLFRLYMPFDQCRQTPLPDCQHNTEVYREVVLQN